MRPFLSAILLVFALTGVAHAATAFFYSDAEEYYGWGADYPTFSRAESEARAGCIVGGKKCQLALECENGYSAVAFADDSAHGVGMSCGMASARAARFIALTVCVNVSRAMCWTGTALDRQGNKYADGDNDVFDRTYYGQQMLFAAGFDAGPADGEMGPRTRKQLMAFEQKFGLPAETEFTTDVLWRLLNVIGGPQVLGTGLYKTLIEPQEASLQNNFYAFASSPAPERNYSVEMASYAADEQLRGLAMILAKNDRACTVPAKSVEPLPADGSGAWNVQCDEGDYTIFFGDGSVTTMSGLSDVTVTADGISAVPRGSGSSTVTTGGSTLTIGGDSDDTTETPRPPAGGTGRTLGH